MPRGRKKRVFEEKGFSPPPVVGSAPDEFTTEGSEGSEGFLEVEDLSAVEFAGMQDDWTHERYEEGGARYERIYFPRESLLKRFGDGRGMLSIPKVVVSEWFGNILKRHHFSVDSYGVVKDSKGRILLRSKKDDGYEVSRRVG